MNRLLKKTLSLMLVIVMTVSLGVSAAAADQTGPRRLRARWVSSAL